MAFRMKHWLGIALLGCALYAVWWLPPSGRRRRPSADRVSPAEGRASRLLDQAWRLNEVQKRLAWVDSLVPLTVAAAEGDFVAGAPENVDAATLERFRGHVSRELDALGDRDRSVRVGIFLQKMSQSAYPGAPSGIQDVEYLMGAAAGAPYCIAVRVERWPDRVHLSDLQWSVVNGFSNILGQCRLVVRYGLPGAGTGPWLRRGGMRFGAYALVENGAERGPTSLPWENPVRRSTFGVRWTAPGLEMDRCMAGYGEACREALLEPSSLRKWRRRGAEVLSQTPVVGADGGGWIGAISRREGTILATLEAEFGRDAFARFWASDLPVEDAFRAAFGTDMGAWMVGWTERRGLASPPGPGLGLSALLGMLVLLLLAGGAGVGWARTREVSG